MCKAVPIGAVLDLRTTTSHKCAVVPSRARLEGSKTFVSLKSRLESNKKKKKKERCPPVVPTTSPRGGGRLFRPPSFVPQAAGFRRTPAQINDFQKPFDRAVSFGGNAECASRQRVISIHHSSPVLNLTGVPRS